MNRLLIFVVAILPLESIDPMITLSQGKTMACQPGCHYVGQDDGFYKDGRCGCIKWYDFDELVGRRIVQVPVVTKHIDSYESPGYHPDTYSSW